MVQLKKRTWNIVLPNGNTMKQTTKQLIINCLNFVGQNGLKTSEMYERIKLIEKITNQDANMEVVEEDYYLLEDAEIKLLIQLEENIQWAYVDQSFIDFKEDLKEAK